MKKNVFFLIYTLEFKCKKGLNLNLYTVPIQIHILCCQGIDPDPLLGFRQDPDPDPHKTEADPKHCLWRLNFPLL
jgi:hypothetical protein